MPECLDGVSTVNIMLQGGCRYLDIPWIQWNRQTSTYIGEFIDIGPCRSFVPSRLKTRAYADAA